MRSGFERYAQLCANEFKRREGHPALVAKYERLIVEARGLGITVGGQLSHALAAERAPQLSADSTLSPELFSALHSLAACATDAERSQRVLELLLDASDAERANYTSSAEAPSRSRPRLAKASAMTDLRSHLTRMLGATDSVDTSGHTATHTFQSRAVADTQPLVIWPIVLTTSRDSGRPIGIAALHFAPEQQVRMPFEVATAVADMLFDTDVDEPSLPPTAITGD